jgi:hypothetical protein
MSGCTPSGPGPDRSDEVFEPTRLLEIDIEMPAADWEYIRNQGRDLTALAEGCLDGPSEKIYEFFPGTVTIDGETLHDVGVRKKGFLGSQLVSRPSLKLKFDEFVLGQLFYGMRRMTLNNNREDPSLARTCMVYRFFDSAGIAAPRCNHAHVTVNGEDMGIYSHVESIKKLFLARNFDDEEGRLYEIQRSDFRAGWVNTFEVKTNLEDTDRSDLEALTAALEVDDDRLLAEIEPLVDVDEFYTFWATENLLGFYDGYTNDMNNSFVYHDPDSDKFHFIPWGVENSFKLRFVLDFGPPRPWSVSAYGMLANRLYFVAGGNTRYVDRMRQLLDTLWVEDELVAEVDRIGALLAPHADVEGLDQIRGFIRNRRAVIEAEFTDGPPVCLGAWAFGRCLPRNRTASFRQLLDHLGLARFIQSIRPRKRRAEHRVERPGTDFQPGGFPGGSGRGRRGGSTVGQDNGAQRRQFSRGSFAID